MAESPTEEQQALPDWTNDFEFEGLLDAAIPNRDRRSLESVVLPVSSARREFSKNIVEAEANLEEIFTSIAGSVGRLREISSDVSLGAQSLEREGLSDNERSLVATILADEINARSPSYRSDARSERLNVYINRVRRFANDRIISGSEQDRFAFERYIFLRTTIQNLLAPKKESPSRTDNYIGLLLDAAKRRNSAPFEAIDKTKKILEPIITDRKVLPGVKYDSGNRPDSIVSHEYRAKRLRAPYMRGFFSLLSKDVEFKRFAQPFLERKDEFAQNTKEDDETHREFTAIFSAILSSERTRELFNTALDRAAMAESQKIAEALEANYTYVPTLVIGSGLAGSIYTSELLHGSPNAQVLTIDSSKRLGGQFAEAEAAALALNSRTRPQDNDEPGQPGNPGNLNPLGPHAVIQLPDITGSTYATQEDFATAIRTNKFLSGPTLLNASATSYEVIPESERINPNAKYKVTIEYTGPDGNKQLKIITDRIRQLTGVGKEAFPLLDAQNEESREAIEQAKRDIESGLIPKILHSSWVYQILGDRSQPFPRNFFTGDVVVVGSNDSANTVIEYILGYGPENRGPIQLDWPKAVTWIGQDAVTKEAFLKKSRPRYVRIALDLKRTGYTYNRITSEPGKALRIEQNFDDTIQVYWRDPDGDPQDIEANRVIFATGYTDQMPTLLEPISPKRTIVAPIDIFDRENNIREPLLKVDAQVYFEDGSTHTIIKRTPKTVTVIVTKGPTDRPSELKLTLNEYVTELKPVGILPAKPSIQSLTEPVEDNSTDAVIARRIPNEDIVIAGVAASIPITSDDIPAIDTFAFIGENTVADFFNEPKIVSLAAADAGALNEADTPQNTPRTILDVLNQDNKSPKKRISNEEADQYSNQYTFDTVRYISAPPYPDSDDGAVRTTRLSRTINMQDLARVVVTGIVDGVEFPKTPENTTLTLRFKRRPEDFLDDNERIVEVYTEEQVDLGDEVLLSTLRKIAQNSDILAIVEALTKAPRMIPIPGRAPEITRINYDSEALLKIPIQADGTVDTNGIIIQKKAWSK